MFPLKFRPFQEFIDKNTIERTRSRFMDSIVLTFEMIQRSFKAMVQGSENMTFVSNLIRCSSEKATCSCPYSDRRRLQAYRQCDVQSRSTTQDLEAKKKRKLIMIRA